MRVEGRYLVEVRLNGYTNPTGSCQGCKRSPGSGLTCCDTVHVTSDCMRDGRQCDSYFVYCLRPFGDARQPPRGCSSDEYRNVSSINTDDGSLDFSQSTVLLLNNPQVLSGLEDIYDEVSLDCSIVVVLLPLPVILRG